MGFLKNIKFILPGIFLLGFNIGTGSVTAMAKAGAAYGLSLLWTILLSCLVTYFMIMIYGKFTLITGQTALYAFRKHLHPVIGIFFIIALTTGVCGSVIGVMGIVSDICYEWSKNILEGGIPPLYWAMFFIVLVYALFWNGKTEFFQKSLALIVAVMGASFIINFFILTPPPIEIIHGLIPNIPSSIKEYPFLVIASMTGTTVFSGLFIIRTTLVKEAEWKLEDEKIQNKDAMISAILMFIISAAIMAAAAGTLHIAGSSLDNASEMIELLEPLAGRFAVTIFVTGIVAAGVSSQFPNVLLLPWLLCDYNNTKRDMKRSNFRIIVMIISLLGLVVPIFDAPPVIVMIVSQAFNAIILPLTVLSIIILGNKESVMGKNMNTMSENIILFAIFIFSIIMSYMGFTGVLNKIITL